MLRAADINQSFIYFCTVLYIFVKSERDKHDLNVYPFLDTLLPDEKLLLNINIDN